MTAKTNYPDLATLDAAILDAAYNAGYADAKAKRDYCSRLDADAYTEGYHAYINEQHPTPAWDERRDAGRRNRS